MNPYNEFEMRAYHLMREWPSENTYKAWRRIYILWDEWEFNNE